MLDTNLHLRHPIKINGETCYLVCKPFSSNLIEPVLENLHYMYEKAESAKGSSAIIADMEILFKNSTKRLGKKEGWDRAEMEENTREINSFLLQLKNESIFIITKDETLSYFMASQKKMSGIEEAFKFAFFLLLFYRYSPMQETEPVDSLVEVEPAEMENGIEILPAKTRESYITSLSFTDIQNSLNTTYTSEEAVPLKKDIRKV